MPTFNYTAWEAHAAAAGKSVFEASVPGAGRVKYYELSTPGPQQSYVARAWRAERTFMVWPYERAWWFAAWLVGWSEIPDAVRGLYQAGPRRVPPQPYPFDNPWTQRPLGYATEIQKVEGCQPDGNKFATTMPPGANINAGNYAFAKVTAVYSAVPYRVVGDAEMPKVAARAVGAAFDAGAALTEPDESTLQRYVHRSLAPSARHLQYPAGTMTWEAEAGDPEEVTTQTIGRMLPYVDVNYTWHKVPAVPKAVFTHIGCVNEHTFDDQLGQTMLLLGVDIQANRQVIGSRDFDIGYRMRFFDGGETKHHNYFLRFKTDPNALSPVRHFKWRRPYYVDESGAHRPVFDLKDFADLFRGPFVAANWTLA